MEAEAPEVEEAREAFRLLLKGIKNIHIYRHAEVRFPEYMQPAHTALTRFLNEHESLAFKIEPFAVKLKDAVVHEDEDRENLTYRFYKDGVRYLIFRRGLTVDELVSFVLLAIENLDEAALMQEDMVTRLWKRELQFIETVVVESFGFDDVSEEEVEIEIEKVIGHLRKQLAANSDDIARFARLDVADLELKLDDIEQVRGGIISGRTALPQDRAEAQDDLITEDKDRLFPKMVFILFQLLEQDGSAEDWALLSDAFTLVLDAQLVAEDIKAVTALLRRFQSVADKPLPDDRRELAEKMGMLIKDRMLDPQRLEALNRYMSSTRDFDAESVRTYLSICTEAQLEALLDLLVKQERSEGRNLLIEVLAELGKSKPEAFAKRLSSGASNVVKDMLELLARIQPKNLTELVAKTLGNDNLMIRLQGLKVLAKSKDEKALRYIERACRDKEMQVRLGAYRALAQKAPLRSADFLVKIARSEAFAGFDQREKVAVYAALGETRSEAGLKFFRSAFENEGNLFQRSRLQEQRMLAVTGLAAMCTVPAFKILAREVQNRKNGKEVMTAAQKAALRVKKIIESRPSQDLAAP
ncbi:MAG: HEAT repeat domain-containing protein [Myxococcota bacterium]